MSKDAQTRRRSRTRADGRRRPTAAAAEGDVTLTLEIRAVSDEDLAEVRELAHKLHAKRLGLADEERGDFEYICDDDLLDLLAADRFLAAGRASSTPAPAPPDDPDIAKLVDALDDMARRYETLTGDARPRTALKLAAEIPRLIGAVRALVRRTARAEQQAAELQTGLDEAIGRIEQAAAAAIAHHEAHEEQEPDAADGRRLEAPPTRQPKGQTE